jgi:predicted transposase/invertase (TIGR01784 family)
LGETVFRGNQIEIHFIELPKFKLFGPKDLRGTPLHRWLKFFDKKITEEELEELVEMDSAIKRAEQKLEYISSDEDALALYRAREDSAHERANLIYTGRMEGIEIGIEERTIQIVKNMLAENTPLDYIVKVTGQGL